MGIGGRRAYRKDLVDLSAGLISREIFVNEEIYQEEIDRIFTRAWLFVGHESQIPGPGDYFVSCMGEESVIVCRDQQGQIHVFLNSCRHRGMKVCRYDEGNTSVFTCPYHGWSYANDGTLVGVPFYTEAYRGRLDRSHRGLVEVTQWCSYKGTVWATWDGSAPPFLEYLGEFKLYLDLTLDAWDGREAGTEVLGGVQKWLIPCNWKFPAENFSGDSYHNISHRSVDLVGIGPSGRGRRDMQERVMVRRLQICFPERGHQTGDPVLRPGRAHRAGRHGELELCPCREPGRDRTALPVQLRAGAGVRSRELRMGRTPVSRVRDGHHRGEVQRAQSEKAVPAVGGVHGGGPILSGTFRRARRSDSHAATLP